jgi:hypothetical protein
MSITDVAPTASEILVFVADLVPAAARVKASETLESVRTALDVRHMLTDDEVELLETSVPRLEALLATHDALWGLHDQLTAAVNEGRDGDDEMVVLLTVALVQAMDRWHELLMREPRFSWAP